MLSTKRLLGLGVAGLVVRGIVVARRQARSVAVPPAARGRQLPARLGVLVRGGSSTERAAATTVLAELGASVVDGRAIVERVLVPGSDALADVVAAFGPDVLTVLGDLDWPALEGLVTDDSDLRCTFQGIVADEVRRAAAAVEQAAPTRAVIVHDPSPLADGLLATDVAAEVLVGTAAAATAARADLEQHVVDVGGTPGEVRARLEQVYATLWAGTRPA